jgi:hypothetical protein
LERYENYAEAIVESFGNDTTYSNIYEIVADGKWTMDTMLRIAELASHDADTTDGDLGVSEMDAVGYFQYDKATLYYFYGAGGRLTEINEETGSPEFVIQNDENGELFDYIYKNFNKNQLNIKFPNGNSGGRKNNFIINGNTLFTEMTFWDIRKDLYINSTFDYGILPNPVYNPGDSYNSLVYFYNLVHLWAIPSLCEDIEKAQLMMNIMAAYSNVEKPDSTMGAYYERTLCFQTAGDSGSREVMNIIKDSMVYDIALLYDWSNLGTIMLGELTVLNDKSAHTANVKNANSIARYKLNPTIEQFKNPSAVQ